jgi:HSP20 family protein
METNKKDPMRDLARIQRGINRVFGDVLDPFAMPFFGEREELGRYMPAVDVEENEKEYLLSLDLPGCSKDNVKIELHEGELIVSGERTEEHKGKHKTKERYYGMFERRFSLPVGVKEDKVKATFDNGVLKITVEKPEETKAKLIPIGTGKNVKAA